MVKLADNNANIFAWDKKNQYLMENGVKDGIHLFVLPNSTKVIYNTHLTTNQKAYH